VNASHSPLTWAFQTAADTLATGHFDRLIRIACLCRKYDFSFSWFFRCLASIALDWLVTGHKGFPPDCSAQSDYVFSFYLIDWTLVFNKSSLLYSRMPPRMGLGSVLNRWVFTAPFLKFLRERRLLIFERLFIVIGLLDSRRLWCWVRFDQHHLTA